MSLLPKATLPLSSSSDRGPARCAYISAFGRRLIYVIIAAAESLAQRRDFMTQDILDRPTSEAASAREYSTPPERLEALYADQREREWRQTADRLEALRDSASAERRQIFPDGQRDEIKRGLVRGGGRARPALPIAGQGARGRARPDPGQGPAGPHLRQVRRDRARGHRVHVPRQSRRQPGRHPRAAAVRVRAARPQQGADVLRALCRRVGPHQPEPGDRRRADRREHLPSRRQLREARVAAARAQP